MSSVGMFLLNHIIEGKIEGGEEVVFYPEVLPGLKCNFYNFYNDIDKNNFLIKYLIIIFKLRLKTSLVK